MSMLKERYKVNLSIVRFESTEFGHTFGGPPIHQGATPPDQTVPMHLLLNLDVTDPLAPLESVDGKLRFLPLYYPLRYGAGGGEAQYSVESDSQIAVLNSMEELGADDGSDYPFPEQFPKLPARLVPLSYKEARAIAASEFGTGSCANNDGRQEDMEILRHIGYWSMIRLGGGFNPIQGDIEWVCQNPVCERHGKRTRTEVFASFTGNLPNDLSIWGPYGACVEIYFCLMPCCQTIVTVNRCT